MPLLSRLGADDRAELLGLVQVFLAEKRFEGCGGLALTEEIRLTIAAHACVLLLRRDTEFFPTLRSILVYPSTYVAPSLRRLPDGTVVEGDQVRAGESWTHGLVVLSWDAARRGAAHPFDGHNVILHEFAHQLDAESGAMEGAPALGAKDRYAAWAFVMEREFAQLRRQSAHGMPTVLDPYGAQNPAEFFAVSVECFFERSALLREHHPELYLELSDYFRQDPATW